MTDYMDRSLRSWEPMEGEVTSRNRGKPWRAFKIFRDLGSNRSIKLTTAYYHGTPYDQVTPGQAVNMSKWAAKFEWHDRVQAHDDHYLMIERQSIEEYEQGKYADYNERRLLIREKLLSNAEKAADQEEKMLDWPLTEQRVVREGEDGEEITYVFHPAKWSKNTIPSMHSIAAGAVTGDWTSRKAVEESFGDDDQWDNLSSEEMATLIEIAEKSGTRRESGH